MAKPKEFELAFCRGRFRGKGKEASAPPLQKFECSSLFITSYFRHNILVQWMAVYNLPCNSNTNSTKGTWENGRGQSPSTL